MNNRFRFRTPVYGADGKFKKFVYWNTVYGAPAVTCRKGDVFRQPEQCTGLRDAENKPIYENDILKDKDGYFCRVEFTLIGYHIYEIKGAFHCEFGREQDYRLAGNIHSGILKCYMQ